MTLGERIDEIMRIKGYTKNFVANKIGIHPSTLNNWIIGKTTPDNLKLDILGDFLSVNTNWILTGEGEPYKKANEANPRAINITMIPLVSQHAQAGYLCGFEDEDYVATLPTIPFIPEHEPQGQYVAFEVRGDSMDDGTTDSYLEGDILICRRIDKSYWQYPLHIKKWDFVLVHRTEGVIVKRIIKHDVQQGIITIHSLNNFYKDRDVALNDLTEIFNVIQVSRTKRR